MLECGPEKDLSLSEIRHWGVGGWEEWDSFFSFSPKEEREENLGTNGGQRLRR